MSNITQAILPAAGLGTRFLPWTKAVPKQLLPIGNQPVIAYVVDECLDAGITDICFVISPGKEAISQYFFEDPALEEELEKRGKLDMLHQLQRYDSVNFHTVYQHEAHGDGHAVLQAHDWVDTDFLAVLFADDFFVESGKGLSELIAAHNHLPEEERGVMIATEEIDIQNSTSYGIVSVSETDPDLHQLKTVSGLVEKPLPQDAPSNLGVVGRYLIPRSTVDLLHKKEASHAKELRLIDAYIDQLGSTPIHTYMCDGTRIDTGTPAGYERGLELIKIQEQSN